MSQKQSDYIKWGLVIAVLTLVFGGTSIFAIFGRGTDIIRGPERMDRMEAHMENSDKNIEINKQDIEALQIYNMTNNIMVANILHDMQRELHQVHVAVTN